MVVIMKSEVRRYKIKGFRDDGVKIRVLLEPAEIIKQKKDPMDPMQVMKDPMGVARQMMNQGMSQVINDSFSISREEYQQQQYMVGEFVKVTIMREDR